MTEEERFGAITLDTQTLQKEGFRFDRGVLRQLRQFKNGPIRVVVSSIVVNETIAHLAEDIRRALQVAKSAVRDADRLSLPLGLPPSTAELDALNPELQAQVRFEVFVADVGALRIPAEFANISDIERRYFAALPPFATRDKKREFPDAIALSSIENWARRNGTRVLAISEDSGWISYESDTIEVLTTLTEALGVLQKDPKQRAHNLIAMIAGQLPLTSLNPATEAFFQLLTTVVEEADFITLAESQMNYEFDFTESKFRGFSLGEGFHIVQIKETELVVEFTATLRITMSSTINFSVYDSVDKDEVQMGSAEISRMVDVEDVGLLVTFWTDIEAKAWEAIEVELSSGSLVIDLGYIEPDGWSDQDDEPRW